MIRVLLELDPQAPPKGFEMSVVLRSACMPFADPTPFELHYSNAHRANYQRDLTGTCRMMQGYDPDLAAHMTVIGQAGFALCGLPVKAVFVPVPKASYLRSIWYDVENAPEDILRDPVYYVLNLCRVLACVEDHQVLSKEHGGQWGMERLNEYRGLIASAYNAYQGETVFEASDAALRSFAEKVLARICQNADFLSVCIKKD